MGTGFRILVVEDEIDLAEPIRAGLLDEGFYVEISTTGENALRRLLDRWDVLILDLGLPDVPGEAILNYLKQRTEYPAVLVLTSRGMIQDKLSLFRQGCDDYLTKPFIFEELLERVRALLRRSQRVLGSNCQYEDLVLNPETYEVIAGEEHVTLTPKEAGILRLLIAASGRVVSRKEILQSVWGVKEDSETNYLGVHLFNLRKKLQQIGRDSWLHTARNSGFVLSSSKSENHGS